MEKLLYRCIDCGHERVGTSKLDGQRCKDCNGAVIPIGKIPKANVINEENKDIYEQLNKCIENIADAMRLFAQEIVNIAINMTKDIKNIDVDELIKELEELKKKNID
jgi:DNA-directed RNA polymerase subunit RPC12/RpoP